MRRDRTTVRRFFVALSLVLVSVSWSHADWRHFRGKAGCGVPEARDIPTDWDADRNIAWKVALPGRGVSSPVIVGDHIVLTASSGVDGDRLHVLCLDARSGTMQWERRFRATGQTLCHPKTCMAGATPASDGERIFAFFSSGDLVCLDLAGNLLWLRGLTLDYPNASISVGMASSPLVVDETCIVQVETDAEAFVAGLDVRTGMNRWKIDRPVTVNWSSPVVVGSRERGWQVILQSVKKLAAVEPRTGRICWERNVGCNVVPSVSVDGDVFYAPSKGLTAFRLDEADASSPKEMWSSHRLRLETASALVHRGQVVAIAGSILKCADARTGDVAWQLRLEGPFSSSPVAAGDHLYAINEKGRCFVVRTGETGAVAATHEFGETILATPAISDGALFVRSDAHLWKISKR